jgi:hypothetical protein
VKTRKKRKVTPISERLASNSSWKGECLEWNGHTAKDGYGNMTVLCDDGKWRPKRVHRLAYEQAYGAIPDGLLVCHSCDNPRCVNPAHLWLGTHKQNTRDMYMKGRDKNAPGEKHPSHTLTEDDVKEIRRLRGGGDITYRRLSERFGVCASHVCAIVHRRAWRHVE